MAFLMRLGSFSQKQAVLCIPIHLSQTPFPHVISGYSMTQPPDLELPCLYNCQLHKPLFFIVILKSSVLATENTKMNLRLDNYHRALSKIEVPNQKGVSPQPHRHSHI